MRLFLKKPVISLALLALLTLLGSSSSLAFAAMDSTGAIINITNGDQTANNALMSADITLNSGVLTVTDNDSGDDALEISYTGNTYTITDNNGGTLTTLIPSATGSGSNTVTIPDNGVTGINFDLLGGNDSVTVNSVQASLTSGFTIAGGTGTDTASINSAINTGAGNISITVDTVNLTASADLDTTGAGTVTLTADGDIAMVSGSSITTAGGNVTLNADRDENSDGGILVAGTINSGGGNITLGGGDDPTTDPAVGTATTSSKGVFVDGGTLNAGAGNITVVGQGAASGTETMGIRVFNGGDVVTTSGSVNMTGTGGGGTFPQGITVVGAGSSVQTGTGGQIVLTGTANASANNDFGVLVQNGNVTATGTGTISITGTTNSSGGGFDTGVSILGTVQSASGNIQINGTGPGGNAGGVRLGANANLSSTNGAIAIEGAASGTRSAFEAVNGTFLGGGTSGNITIAADTFSATGGLSVAGTASLTIQPRTIGTTIGLGDSATGTLNLDDAELGTLQDGFSNITIGDTTNGTGAVDIDTATFTDPVTIAGGTINDNAGTDIDADTNAVTLDGNVAPGQSPGQLVVNGNLNFTSGHTLTLEINGTTAGTNFDQVQVTGSNRTVTLAGATLTGTLGGGYTPDNADELVIIDNTDSGSTVSGTFNGLAEGAEVPIGDYKFTITYAGGDGNDVVLNNPVPLAVDLALFETEADTDSILIRWQTVSEQDNLGFNLYRATEIDGEQSQLNSALIPAQAPGSGQGAEYEWLDRTVEAGSSYFYWLEDVEVNGSTTLHGPISATVNQATAVTTTQLSTDSSRSGLAGLVSLMLTLFVGGWLLRRQRR